MSVTLGENAIILAGNCGVEEAETLLALVQANPETPVDIARVEWLHTALWQVILALAPQITGEPSHKFIREWMMPLVGGVTRDTKVS